jgi:hypothetical protein
MHFFWQNNGPCAGKILIKGLNEELSLSLFPSQYVTALSVIAQSFIWLKYSSIIMLVVIEDLRFRSDSVYEWITQTVGDKNSSPRACFGAVLCRHNIINYRVTQGKII